MHRTPGALGLTALSPALGSRRGKCNTPSLHVAEEEGLSELPAVAARGVAGPRPRALALQRFRRDSASTSLFSLPGLLGRQLDNVPAVH